MKAQPAALALGLIIILQGTKLYGLAKTPSQKTGLPAKFAFRTAGLFNIARLYAWILEPSLLRPVWLVDMRTEPELAASG